MPITKGTKEASDIFYGETEIQEVRLGETLKYVANQIIPLGVGSTFNIASIYPKYKELTGGNFFCTTFNSASASDSTNGDGVTYVYVNLFADFYKSYNANTGTLTMFNGCGDTTNILGMNRGAVNGYLITKPSKLIYLGFGSSFNVKHIEGYQYFTADNFLIENIPLHRSSDHYIFREGSVYSNSASGSSRLVKSYNASTGVLTCYWYASASDNYGNEDTWSQGCYMYLNPKV